MKHHTFRVNCSFVIQHTFTDREVMKDPDGPDEDILPIESALAELRAEIAASLGENYAISSFSVETASDDLLGTEED